MDNNKQIIWLVFFIFLLTLNSFGQAKSITELEYNTVEKVAEDNFQKVSYKEITKTEEFTNGKLISTETVTELNLPPDKSSYIDITVTNGKTEKTEIITIGYVEYRRENNGKWKQETDEDGNIISGEPIRTIRGAEAANTKKFTIEETKLNGQPVTIYSQTTIYNFNPNISHSFRRWINKENLILRTEEIETEISSGVINRRSISTNEYNLLNTKISAPITKVIPRK